MTKKISLCSQGVVDPIQRQTNLFKLLNSGPVKFKSIEERNTFMRLTEIIPQKKTVKLPFKSMSQCLDEYNLVTQLKSKLNYNERIQVKNIIHQQVRLGKIILTVE